MHSLAIIVIAPVLLAGLGPAPSKEVGPVDDRAAIAETIRSFVAAYNSGDLRVVLAYYDEDLVKLRTGAEAETKAETARRVEETFRRYRTRVEVDNVETEVAGDLAFTRGTFRVTLTPREGGPTQEFVRRYLEIWRRKDGRWRVARTMDNAARP